MYRPLQKAVALMSRWERWALVALILLLVLSASALVRRFRHENTLVVPATGGSYIEGSVGSLQPLNPWFSVQNDVNRDMVSLVFSGLLRFNPQTRNIEEDLATMQVSADQKTYTLRLKDNLFWHDSTPDAPHPVTADDVLFTFQSIQDPQFPNPLLQENFRGVTLAKVDDRTVRFTLAAPYSFFPSNLTMGLVPRKSFEGFAITNYNRIDPVGAGPYRIRDIVQTDLSSEVTLEQFPRTLKPVYHLEQIVFRIYPNYSALLSDLRNLQGVRLVARNDKGVPLIPKRFVARNYYLPQYVALFLNMDRRTLQDAKLRLGLQLGTNKQAVVDAIGESVIVDTPLLEIDVSDWRYQFDANAAQGALLASRWNIPERLRLQKILELEQANNTGILKMEPIILGDRVRRLTLSGSYADVPRGSKLQGVPLEPQETNSGSWIVRLPILTGTGALPAGETLLRLTDPSGRTIDSFFLFVAESPDVYQAAVQERQLAKRYVDTKSTGTGQTTKVVIGDLAMEKGMLRLRKASDAPSIRVNERGEPLHLTLLTSNAPGDYKTIAEEIQRQWAALGVQVQVDIPANRQEFEGRLLRRDYDILLFGQSLLDNLDSYPYWHSSSVQRLTGQENDLRRDAYNLSQYASFEADALLETMRTTADEDVRQKALSELREVLKTDVPAIFLYSPLYTYAHREKILGIELGSLSLHSDRFLTLYRWYVKEDRIFAPGKSWMSFPGWLVSLF